MTVLFGARDLDSSTGIDCVEAVLEYVAGIWLVAPVPKPGVTAAASADPVTWRVPAPDPPHTTHAIPAAPTTTAPGAGAGAGAPSPAAPGAGAPAAASASASTASPAAASTRAAAGTPDAGIPDGRIPHVDAQDVLGTAPEGDAVVRAFACASGARLGDLPEEWARLQRLEWLRDHHGPDSGPVDVPGTPWVDELARAAALLWIGVIPVPGAPPLVDLPPSWEVLTG